MTERFRRIAIVNRGEPAVRLLRAVRELQQEGEPGYRALALYTDSDREALFVRGADEAFALGSATFVDPRDGRRKSRYLDYTALERALRESGAEAAWVGWGFVAEHAEFAELCARLRVVFVGPDPAVMRALGDKIGSKRMAEQAGVPVAPWSGGPVASLAEARAQAERLGFPLMVKATAGGGGRGIRRVRGADELAEAFESARGEALAGFGDETVFMERLLEGARHVEVQVVGDGQGGAWALGVRDCSVQRRNQKVIEESPSPGLTAAEQRELCDAAVRLALRAGYRGAGTVEFLFDPRRRVSSFMEVNARLQVEHPVTECTTGVDLVKLQLHVAQGGRLEGPPPEPRGHAIEVRINAEDPERGFAPAPGRIELFLPPAGPGVRVDSGFAAGDLVAPEFDSMLAKLVCSGRDRAEALARLRRALLETRLALRGGTSNKGFLLGLLDRPEVRSGEVDVGWLDRLAAAGEHLPDAGAEVALLEAALSAYESERAVEQQRFFATAARGRIQLRSEMGYEVELRMRGVRYELRVLRLGPDAYRVLMDGDAVDVRAEPLGPLERKLEFAGRACHVLSIAEGPDQLVEVDGIPHRLTRDAAGVVRAPSPAMVMHVATSEGARVERGQRLVVLEAMKSELPVAAPCAGRVRSVLVAPGVQVDGGAPLVLLEPEEREEVAETGERLRLPHDGERAAPDAGAHCRRHLAALRRLLLGFDVDAAEAERLQREHERVCRSLAADDPELVRGERELLRIFADLCALFEGRTPGAPAEARTPEEYLLLYLRSLDTEAAGVSPSFVDRLQRALSHYGIAELGRTPRLEEALLWVCKAHERASRQVPVVLDILERWLALPARSAEDEERELLDRLIAATRARFLAVSDLAREVRYRSFDRPRFERARERTYAEAESHLSALHAGAGGAEREAHLCALVECPQPLVAGYFARLAGADPALRLLMLEVATRRYYRIRALEGLRAQEVAGRGVVAAEYDHEGGRVAVFTTHGGWGDLEAAARDLGPALSALPQGREAVLDLYLSREGPRRADDATAEELAGRLRALRLPRPVRRLVVAVACADGGSGMGAVQHFTFRPEPDGVFREERISRGLHPMMGKRLQLWRLGQFEIQRLPSSEDVYLFHGAARVNPRDERLFAFAEVRDLQVERDEAGRAVRLPGLEFAYLEALAAIRRVQSRRGKRRLAWNRVVLYVWPPLTLEMDELAEIAHRLAPAARGLGLQKTVVRARMPRGPGGALVDTIVQLAMPGGRQVEISFTPPADRPIAPLSEYGQKVVRMRQRDLFYPYELIRLLTPEADAPRAAFPRGTFQEYDLDDAGRAVPVTRPPGGNRAKLVLGVVRSFTARYPEGMERVLLASDPSDEMGSFAEPECRRIIAALDLAELRRVPVEWYPISAGAKIAMDSGTENLDWTAAALRRLVEFTQAGGEVNVVVTGINVGGQSYWNAEATMLMHTRGILVMTPEASMVLTGKKALDYSGGVSAEDHQGIGGYERIMGVNGQGQYWARDLVEACQILFRHYEHSYAAPGERFPRRAPTSDPHDRDVRAYPYGPSGHGFETVGEIWDDEKNPGRRRPFAVRSVMRAVVDQDHDPLERWGDMREAETAVVWDAHLGGIPVSLVGFESQPVPRLGFVPADGPEQWTPGTLFPLSSKKVARAITAASGSRPVVVLANLSGFDGSPESLRRLQLEFGAEIGRAVVNFRGPLVFCVISRYHGGAYVVFSRTLNENLEVGAVEGSYASVIGGAPAAAVVFAGEVERRARSDGRLEVLDRQIAEAPEAARGRLRARWHAVYEQVHSEKLGEVADEFDRVHSVQRAQKVGSVHEILRAERLRPYLIEAVERGMARVRGS